MLLVSTLQNGMLLSSEARPKTIAMGPVAKTQIGAKEMQFAAVTEFETFEKAMSFKDHPDYVDALRELGDDETKVVKRTSCVISG